MRVPLPLATLSMLGVNTAIVVWSSSRAESVEAWGFVPAQPSLAECADEPVCACGLAALAERTRCFWGCLGSMWSARWGRGGGWRCTWLSGLGAIGVHWAMSLTIQPSLYREGLVGASGAISGLVGYFALRFYRRRVRLVWASPSRWGLSVPMWVGVLAWVLLQGAGAILEAGQPTPSAIGYWAHLGRVRDGAGACAAVGCGGAGRARVPAGAGGTRALQQGAAGDALRYLQQLPAT
jgi:hypothetical protein